MTGWEIDGLATGGATTSCLEAQPRLPTHHQERGLVWLACDMQELKARFYRPPRIGEESEEKAMADIANIVFVFIEVPPITQSHTQTRTWFVADWARGGGADLCLCACVVACVCAWLPRRR